MICTVIENIANSGVARTSFRGADLGGRSGSGPPFGGELTICHYAITHQNASNGNNNVNKIRLHDSIFYLTRRTLNATAYPSFVLCKTI